MVRLRTVIGAEVTEKSQMKKMKGSELMQNGADMFRGEELGNH